MLLNIQHRSFKITAMINPERSDFMHGNPNVFYGNFSSREVGKHCNFLTKNELGQSCHVLTTKVATSHQLKLPCKNVQDEMLKIRTFRFYRVHKNCVTKYLHAFFVVMYYSLTSSRYILLSTEVDCCCSIYTSPRRLKLT